MSDIYFGLIKQDPDFACIKDLLELAAKRGALLRRIFSRPDSSSYTIAFLQGMVESQTAMGFTNLYSRCVMGIKPVPIVVRNPETYKNVFAPTPPSSPVIPCEQRPPPPTKPPPPLPPRPEIFKEAWAPPELPDLREVVAAKADMKARGIESQQPATELAARVAARTLLSPRAGPDAMAPPHAEPVVMTDTATQWDLSVFHEALRERHRKRLANPVLCITNVQLAERAQYGGESLLALQPGVDEPPPLEPISDWSWLASMGIRGEA